MDQIIRLIGGPLDGLLKIVQSMDQWDEVQNLGIANTSGAVTASYRRQHVPPNCVTEHINFEFAPNGIELAPGETARVLRLFED